MPELDISLLKADLPYEVTFLHDGGYYQLATLEDLSSQGHRIRPVYLPDLLQGIDSLVDTERLFVSDRLHARLWAEAADACVDVARRGGILFLSGENAVDRVPGVTARRTPTNFWWWVTGEDPGIFVHATDEPLQRELSLRAQRWHHHHVLEVPDDAVVLASHASPVDPTLAGALLAVDRSSTPGIIAVTGLDPVYHHGSRFMPGASEMLHGVMRWLSQATLP